MSFALLWDIPSKDFLTSARYMCFFEGDINICILCSPVRPVTRYSTSIGGLKNIFIPISFQSLSLLGNINKLTKGKPLECIFND